MIEQYQEKNIRKKEQNLQLDYSLQTPEERIEQVNELIKNTPSENLNSRYLSYMSDYILFISDKNQTKREKKEDHSILTKNREVTINKRQTSFEELVSNLENGEDGLYALIRNDKNQIMDNREKITQEDLDRNPRFQEMVDLVHSLTKQFNTATGARKFSLKRQIIETWQQIYILKKSINGAPVYPRIGSQVKAIANVDLPENIVLDDNLMPQSDCIISLFNPEHISFLLCNYAQLKQESYGNFQSDMFYLLLDLEALVEKTLAENNEILYDIVILKIDGLTNEEIQKEMTAKYGVRHNEQYYSTIWRQRIPKLLAEQAQKDWLEWYYTNEEYGYWKKCNRCGEIKLAHSMFYSKNTSKDGWYSICKECRSTKNKDK